MYTILTKEQLSPVIDYMKIEAPAIAKKARAGQFVVIRVDEKGTEIAAVTEIGMVGRREPERRVTFRVDHPFLFVIYDRVSGAILFVGRVIRPFTPG